MNKTAKKAFFAMILVVALMLSACASPETVTPGQSVTPTVTTTPTATPEATATPTPTPTPEPTVYPKASKLPESTPIPEEVRNVVVTVYVSPNGNDSAVGSREEPIATIDEALKRAKELKKTVSDGDIELCFFGGEYYTEGFDIGVTLSGSEGSRLIFTAADGDEVIFTGAKSVDSSLFTKVSGAEAERLYPEARDNVYVCDLEAAGFTKSDIGYLYATGNSYADKYDGNYVGLNADVYCDDERLIWARYPDTGYLKFKGIVSSGASSTSGRNPKGPVVMLDKTTNERTKNWQIRSDIWLKGYFGRDYSSDVSPVKGIDNDESELEMLFAARHGVNAGAEYFFYNVFEELTTENECYIDRENMLLYIYTEKGMEDRKIRIAMAERPLLMASGTDFVTFDGIIFEGSRVNNIELSDCWNWIFEYCKIRNNGNWGLYFSGSNTVISNCEVYHTGKGGISVTGGNAGKLTPGNNVIINCYVHDWSQVIPTSGAGIEISGSGNRIAHNEIARSPHFAIWYSGTDEIIEYNYLHEVNLEAGDSGAIYSGRSWISYGCAIRYNIIENVGGNDYFPAAIYWDDTLAGQSAYGNVIINSGKGILAGGGRENKIFDNIFLNCREYSILFDQRGSDWSDGWLDLNSSSGLWAELKRVRNSYEWMIRFPNVAKLHADTSNSDDEYFCLNTAHSAITDNIFVYNGSSVTRGLEGCLVEPQIFKYGAVRDNFFCEDRSECLEEGSYELIEGILQYVPDFERIPVEKIGIEK